MHVIIDNWDILHAKSVSILIQIAVNEEHILAVQRNKQGYCRKLAKFNNKAEFIQLTSWYK